jgi:hypothetical protein
MDKIALITAILNCDTKQSSPNKGSCFLEKGKIYAVRTVTMIYTGRLLDFNEQEFLFDEVAWIPETERWADFAATGAHKESEPYPGRVVIGRGGLLDCFEIPSLIRKQK